MSNNFINEVLSYNFIFIKHDNNFVITYINFLKMLNARLNLNTLPFLFEEEKGRFPLLDIAITFHNHPNDDVRNIVKDIILNIIKIDYKPLIKYLCGLPSISYFCFLACDLKDKIVNLSNEIQKNKNQENNSNCEIIKILFIDIVNSLIHIQNIFDVNRQKINFVLINCLFYYCILPYILYNLNYDKEEIKNSGKKLKKSICIIVLIMLCRYIKNDIFLNILFTLIFFPSKLKSINYYMESKPIQPLNYYSKWNEGLKHSTNSFLNYIQFNFNSSFLKSLIYKDNSKYIEVKQISKKYQDKKLNEPNFNIDKNKESNLKEIIKDILNKLKSSELTIMLSYHSYLSIATGINCGLSTKNNNSCIIPKMHKFFQKYYSNEEEQKNKLIKNYIKQHLFKILKNKKSNKKLLLINLLLKNILYHNQNISKTLLNEVSIISADLLKEEQISYLVDINKENNQPNRQANENNYKNNIYNNNGISIEVKQKNKNSKIMNENKENCDINNKQYFETDAFKKSKIANTMISINQFMINSRYSVIEPTKKLVNLDNNDSLQDIDNDKNNNNEFIIHKKSDESIKTFCLKNKYSFLSNEYYNNLEKDLKLSSNNYYNEKLIELLISLLDINSNIEPEILKITIDNILLLVTKKFDNNKIQVLISQEHKDKIKNIYEAYKNEIIYYYNNKKSFHNNTYRLFIKQYDNYLLLNELDFDSCIENIFMNNTFINNKENISKNKYDKIIISFLLIHDFYYTINSSQNIIETELLENTLYKKSFILINQQNYYFHINKEYSVFNLDSSIRYYECKCKIIINKKDINENFFDSYILLLNNFIYIGDSSNDSSYTIIKYKFLLSNCSVLSDNYNNKNIIIIIENNYYDNNNIEIFLDFKDYKSSKFIKSLIDEEIKKSFFYEKDKIKQFFESLK